MGENTVTRKLLRLKVIIYTHAWLIALFRLLEEGKGWKKYLSNNIWQFCLVKRVEAWSSLKTSVCRHERQGKLFINLVFIVFNFIQKRRIIEASSWKDYYYHQRGLLNNMSFKCAVDWASKVFTSQKQYLYFGKAVAYVYYCYYDLSPLVVKDCSSDDSSLAL